MALLFRHKRPAVVGVDWSATAVKVAQLSHRPEGITVEGFASISIAPGVIADNMIRDGAALSAALVSALSQARMGTTHVAAIALPAAQVISKTLQLDAVIPEQELEAYMQLEAAALIPFPLKEVYRDFCVLGLHEKDPTKMDVLLVATRRAPVDRRLMALEQAGLRVGCVELDIFALERLVNYLNPIENKTIALINVNTAVVMMMVIHRKRVIYNREEVWSNPLAMEVDLLMPLLRRFMQFFLSLTSSHPIDCIWLTGESALTMDLCDRIAENLSLPCSKLQPFQTMSLAPGIDADALKENESSLALACGLALRGMKP